jgi:hypothetical protein
VLAYVSPVTQRIIIAFRRHVHTHYGNKPIYILHQLAAEWNVRIKKLAENLLVMQYLDKSWRSEMSICTELSGIKNVNHVQQVLLAIALLLMASTTPVGVGGT